MSPLATTVIPAYNEGKRLPTLLEDLARVAVESPTPCQEILVVDDGSRPEDVEIERAAVDRAQARIEQAGLEHRFRFLAAPENRGKGSAIRLGWASADPGSRWLGFMDADGAISAEEHQRLLRILAEDPACDVLAGSRVKMAGKHIERRLFRHLQGRVFATMTEDLLELGFYDTQCGVKFARASILRDALGELHEERWLLDIELLGVLKRRGARLREEPIDWVDAADSRVRFGVDAARMFVGLLRLKRRLESQRPR